MLLGNVSKIKTGNLDVNAKVENGRYPFFTCAQIPERIDSYSFDCECVLVAGNGDLNVKYYNGKFDVYQRTYVMEITEKNQLDTRFLFHFLNKYLEKLRVQSIGGVIKYIKMANLSDIELPDFTLEKQKQIVQTLDTADNLRQKRKEQLNLLDDYLKSVFLEMFGNPVRNEKGWDSYKGRAYSDLITVGVVIKPASYYTDKGVVALRSLNIKPNLINLENVVYFSEKSSNGALAKSILKQGDVVVVRTGLTGTAAVVPPELEGANCIDLIIVRPKVNMLNPFYLTFLLNSDMGKRLVSSKEVGGIQKHFNVGSIKDIKIPLPPINLQNKFASIVEQIKQTKQKMHASLDEMDNHFNALMQRYFG